jgi:VanZ like family
LKKSSGNVEKIFRGAAWSNPAVAKGTLRVVTVPRSVTMILLLVVSVAMVALIAWLSGRAYLRARLTVPEVVSLIHRYDEGVVSNDALLATAAPGIVDILFFMPWGALAFLAFDGGEQHRLRTYLLTLAVGVTFALGLVAWQSALPTRVTGWDDAGWNTLGCFAGGVAGHLRKRVRIRFD